MERQRDEVRGGNTEVTLHRGDPLDPRYVEVDVMTEVDSLSILRRRHRFDG